MTTKVIEVSCPKQGTSTSDPNIRHVINPVIDFLFLGGASLVIVPAVAYFIPLSVQPQLILWALILFYFTNYPHFGASYQIFYRNFTGKISGSVLNRGLQRRYIFAGIVIPLALVAFLLVALRQPDIGMLGYSINVIGILTAWHYLKQGYGMLIVDSVFTRRFFNEREKRVFLYNAYACLLFYWALFNRILSTVGFQGLYFHTIPIPSFLFYGACGTVFATSAAVIYILGRKFVANRGAIPINGVVAYMATTYLWLLALLNPLTAVTIPIFHALQYLSVVWRYESNREMAAKNQPLSILWRYYVFVMVILLIGYIGLWKIPEAHLEKMIGFDRAAYGGALVLFVFWYFVNIHHYFLDNVIWRSENPDTRAYLFHGPTNKPL